MLAWRQLWRRFHIRLQGGEGTALPAVRLHLFHLLQTVSTNSVDIDVGVPARGLHGEAYRGHVLWDELFVFPFRRTHGVDAAGLARARIVASGGLDEHGVAALVAQGAPIDAYGIGTKMGVSADAPSRVRTAAGAGHARWAPGRVGRSRRGGPGGAWPVRRRPGLVACRGPPAGLAAAADRRSDRSPRRAPGAGGAAVGARVNQGVGLTRQVPG